MVGTASLRAIMDAVQPFSLTAGAVFAITLLLSHNAWAGNPCQPLPPGNPVVFDIHGGSAEGLARTLACFKGLNPVFRPGFKDVPIQVVTGKPVPLSMAFVKARKSMAEACLRMRVKGKRLLLGASGKGKGTGKRCGPPESKPRQIRSVSNRIAGWVTLTTRGAVSSEVNRAVGRPGAVNRIGDGQYRMSSEIRSLAALGPAVFASEAVVLPPLFGKDAVGFTVLKVRPDGLFDKMGLKIGDVLKKINGRPLNTMADARAAYIKLVKDDIISLQVLRGTETLILRYFFKEPSPDDRKDGKGG